jgi:uncharacterized membrane protein (DUF485 family)
MNDMDKNFELGKAIAKSRLTMPDTNFEKLVMERVNKEIQLKKIKNYMLCSVVFFAGFVLLGYFMSIHLAAYLTGNSVWMPSVKLGLEVVFIAFVILWFERLVRYAKSQNVQFLKI